MGNGMQAGNCWGEDFSSSLLGRDGQSNICCVQHREEEVVM